MFLACLGDFMKNMPSHQAIVRFYESKHALRAESFEKIKNG
jgi:hypothetical protein